MSLSRKLKTSAAAVLLSLGAAHAADNWTVSTGDDPMTDEKWAAMSTASNLGAPILIKCWEKGAIQAAVVVGRYDDSASYKPLISAKFRFDKGEPIDVLMQPANFNGMLALGAIDDDAKAILKGVSTARDRMVFSVGGSPTLFQAGVRGAAKSADVLKKVCHLNDGP